MKIALIGYGYWGKIIEKYFALCDMELVYVFCREKINHEKQTGDIEVIWRDQTIDSVIVCTPILTHYEICKAALLAGKNVFCEKPTTKNLQEYMELQNLAKQTGKILYTDYIYTTSPSVQYMKDHMGSIGKLCAIRAHIEQFGKFYPQDDVYEVLGVHMISAIRYATNLQGFHPAFRHFFTEKLPLAGEITYELENGCHVSIYCSLIGIKKIRTIQFIGQFGSLEFSLNTKPNIMIQYYKSESNAVYHGERIEKSFDESCGLVYALDYFRNLILDRDQNQNNQKVSLEIYNILKGNRNE